MRTSRQALDAIAARPDGAVVLGAMRATTGAWLVGGAVRDALLGCEPRELDVVVEGDPEPLIAALGGVVLERHERFGTATVDVGCGAPVDVVLARTERYPAPGALPEVQPAAIDADLLRRDVTLNAIALDHAARLRAAPGGVEDLQARVLRVLHDRSFADDPTRLWRVARYAARLGFAIESHTRALAGVADASTVSGARHGNELRIALQEPDPRATLSQTAELQPRLLPDGFDPQPSRLDDALALLPDGARADLVTLAACTALVDAARLVAWLEDLEFPAGDRDLVAAGSRSSTHVPLHSARANSEVARAARGVPVEVVALAGGENARRWIAELRHVALSISGDDLIAAGIAPGPEIGRRLSRALDRKLDEGLASREAELAVALAPL